MGIYPKVPTILSGDDPLSPSAMALSPTLVETMTRHAESTYPQECCGVLLGLGQAVRAVIPMENAWGRDGLDGVFDETGFEETLEHSRRDRYALDPQALLQVMKQARGDGLEVVGIFHSHPDHPAVPSECDRRLAWPQYLYVILSVERGQVVDVRHWVLKDRAFVELLF
jgi:proteasome lid subunit RPN8/RPN11